MTSAVTAEFLAPDSWLTRTLQTNSFALGSPLPADAALIGRALSQAAGQDEAFFFGKVPAREAAAVGMLQRLGFRLVETEVSFEHRDRSPTPGAPGIAVRPAEARDRERVLEMAGSRFTSSRFHRDPLIGHAAAHRVKRLWAENCLDGMRAREVLVAGAKDAVGFLAVRVLEKSGATSAVIDLVAVDEGHQGRGIGTALVREFVRRWQPRAARLMVGTQLSNGRSLRLYEACGFQFLDAAYVMHAHWQSGEVKP